MAADGTRTHLVRGMLKPPHALITDRNMQLAEIAILPTTGKLDQSPTKKASNRSTRMAQNRSEWVLRPSHRY
jgi:hypothetical protein